MIKRKSSIPTNECNCPYCGVALTFEEEDLKCGYLGVRGFECPDCGEWITIENNNHIRTKPTFPSSFYHFGNGKHLDDSEIQHFVDIVTKNLKQLDAGEFYSTGTGDTIVIGMKSEDESSIIVAKNYWEDTIFNGEILK